MQRRFVSLLSIALLFLLASSSGSAQGRYDRLFPSDSSHIIELGDTLVPVHYLPIDLDDCGFFMVPHDTSHIEFRDSASFAEHIERWSFVRNCEGTVFPDIDFTDTILIGLNEFYDCNGLVLIHVYRHTERPEYRVYVDNHYGGCRGMTSRSFWLAIPVEDVATAQFVMIGRRYDRIHGG